MKKYDCMLMAGGINRINFHKNSPKYKSLIKFKGKSSIEHVIAALRKCKYVRDIVICGPKIVKGYKIISSRGYILNAIKRCSHHTRTEKVFVVMADTPLLEPRMLDSFFKKANDEKEDADFYIAFVNSRHFKNKFKKFRKPFRYLGHAQFAYLKDGQFAHGNLMIFRKSLLKRKDLIRRIENFYRVRKYELKLARLVGIHFWLHYFFNVYLLHRITTDNVAEMLGKIFGVKVKVVKLPYPELAIDIDEKKDFELINEIFDGRRN